MGKFGDIRKAEGPCTTLDGMRCTENGIDDIRIRFAHIKIQQLRLHNSNAFFTLLEEDLMELRQIYIYI